MAFRINPAKIPLWRTPNEIQYGVQAPLVIEGVTEQQERLLRLLERGVAEEEIDTSQNGLIERLGPVLLESSRIVKPQLDSDFVRGAFAELIRASFTNGIDGIAVMENRAKATVHIDSLGLAGVLLTLGLAAVGVGRILTTDRELVTEHELSPLGYPTSALGQPRQKALTDLLRTRPGNTLLLDFDSLTPAKARHQLRILVAQNAINPARYKKLATPHIAVFFGESEVSVTPRITATPCLACLDLAKTDSDPLWPTLAAQLLGRREYLEDARSSMFAASMVIGELVRAIDSPREEQDFNGHRLNVHTGLVESWTWAKHPACECRQ